MKKVNGDRYKRIDLTIVRIYEKRISTQIVCPDEIYDQNKVDDFIKSYCNKNKESIDADFEDTELYLFEKELYYDVYESRYVGQGTINNN